MFNEEDSQEGFTSVFKKSTDSAPSKSNDEIIDLTSNNNDDIIVMVEVACDLPSRDSSPPSRDSSDTNNNNMGKNSQINDDSELFRIDYAQDDNRPVLKTPKLICSDETILTGYKPNIKMNEKKLATDIKQAIGSGKSTKSTKNFNIQYNEEPIYSNLTIEQQTIKVILIIKRFYILKYIFIFDIILKAIFGKNGVIPRINSQKKDLVYIYSSIF